MLRQLKHKFKDTYTEKNVMISGTHTHSAPGGYLMDFLFDVSSLGFVSETFNALVKGIVLVNSYYIHKPAVHSCQENPRQRESENVDGNIRLASDALV